MPIYRDRQAKWQGSVHAQGADSGCWCLQLLGARPTVLRIESSPGRGRTFHDTCCIIALLRRTYPLHEYQTREADPISCCPGQLVASTATAQAQCCADLVAPVALSLTCSVSRIPTAPKWILYSTVLYVVCVLLQGCIVKSPLWIQNPGSGKSAHWAEQSSRRSQHTAT